MTRRFTGRHMALGMIAFFAVVSGVNFTMAWLAVGSFGGTVVDNSYVASQRYNGWLAKARAQSALGWKPEISTDAARHVIVSIKTATGSLDRVKISAIATHPIGALPPVKLTFAQAGQGLRSREPLTGGRWLLRIDVAHGKDSAVFDAEIGS